MLLTWRASINLRDWFQINNLGTIISDNKFNKKTDFRSTTWGQCGRGQPFSGWLTKYQPQSVSRSQKKDKYEHKYKNKHKYEYKYKKQILVCLFCNVCLILGSCSTPAWCRIQPFQVRRQHGHAPPQSRLIGEVLDRRHMHSASLTFHKGWASSQSQLTTLCSCCWQEWWRFQR